MIRLTSTGKLFAVAAVLLYLASLTSQSGLLLLPIGILFGCYLVNVFAARRSVHAVEIQPPASLQVSEGERPNQPWRVTNRSPKPVGLLTFTSPAGELFRLARMEKGEARNLIPELSFQRRGVFPNARIKVSSIFPFGFVRVERVLDLPGEIVVYPALYPTHPPRAAGYDVMVGGKFQGNRRASAGASFAGVRPMLAGDPLRNVHWKASSKGQGLMVKTFDEELAGRVALILDTTGEDAFLDDAVRAAGSLMFAALDEGHHVEFIIPGETEAMLIPPFADGHEILERLARIETQSDSITPDTLSVAVSKVSSRSALCLVFSSVNELILTALYRLVEQGREVTLCVPADAEFTAESERLTVRRFEPRTMHDPT
jgi:uncharacterized protein (DUF58 family)